MEEDIIKIIKENAGITLKDWALINPEKVSKEIAFHMKEFNDWRNSQSDNLEYFTFETTYECWKNNIRK